MKQRLLNLLKSGARVVGLLSVILLLFQNQLIYMPRGYSPEIIATATAKPLHYQTSQGDQVAWLKNESAPDLSTVWLVTCGNGTCGLDLANYFDGVPSFARDVFVFADYPGYGSCTGRPTPDSIRESLRALIPALAERLHVQAEVLKPKLRVWGHSLGCAAALMAMEEHGIRRGVLIAPFRTMLDMAQRRVGWPLCYLLHHRFDNVTSLAHLQERGDSRIEVIHGTNDEVIPQSQGRALAVTFPQLINFESADGAYHNHILNTHRSRIMAAMERAKL